VSILIEKSNGSTGVVTDRPMPQLPSKPVLVIEHTKTKLFDFRELWKYRQLCYFFIWRDLKVRYRQTLLGVTWVIIQPLFTMLIFTYFFGSLAKIPSDGIPYSIFYYTGLTLWIFFSNSVTNCSNSLINDRNLITKIYFPRMIIPAAAVLSGLIDLLIAMLLLIFLLLYEGFLPTWRFLMLPVILFPVVTYTFSLGMLLAALNVRYRDVRYVLPFVTQLLFFVTPIIFPLNMVPAKQRWLIMLNPLTGAIEELRASVSGREIDLQSFGVSLIATLIFFCFCSYIFKRLEKVFAETI
jgi:lipopolysaccharide transport system permease protein